jgi:hypothetical protein
VKYERPWTASDLHGGGVGPVTPTSADPAHERDLTRCPGLACGQRRSDLAAEPWRQDPQNPKHIHNSRDEIVALVFSEPDAERVAAAINAVASLPTELLKTSVIAEASEELLVLYGKHAPDRE